MVVVVLVALVVALVVAVVAVVLVVALVVVLLLPTPFSTPRPVCHVGQWFFQQRRQTKPQKRVHLGVCFVGRRHGSEMHATRRRPR